jgi:mRNA interferase MazF
VNYAPDAGDLVWLDFDPQAGRDQAGRRPALVLTRKAYNSRSGLAIVRPVTSKVKGYPLEVVLPTNSAVHGVALADHARSLDWNARRVEFIARAPVDVVEEVLEKLEALLFQ